MSAIRWKFAFLTCLCMAMPAIAQTTGGEAATPPPTVTPDPAAGTAPAEPPQDPATPPVTEPAPPPPAPSPTPEPPAPPAPAPVAPSNEPPAAPPPPAPEPTAQATPPPTVAIEVAAQPPPAAPAVGAAPATPPEEKKDEQKPADPPQANAPPSSGQAAPAAASPNHPRYETVTRCDGKVIESAAQCRGKLEISAQGPDGGTISATAQRGDDKAAAAEASAEGGDNNVTEASATLSPDGAMSATAKGKSGKGGKARSNAGIAASPRRPVKVETPSGKAATGCNAECKAKKQKAADLVVSAPSAPPPPPSIPVPAPAVAVVNVTPRAVTSNAVCADGADMSLQPELSPDGPEIGPIQTAAGITSDVFDVMRTGEDTFQVCIWDQKEYSLVRGCERPLLRGTWGCGHPGEPDEDRDKCAVCEPVRYGSTIVMKCPLTFPESDPNAYRKARLWLQCPDGEPFHTPDAASRLGNEKGELAYEVRFHEPK